MTYILYWFSKQERGTKAVDDTTVVAGIVVAVAMGTKQDSEATAL